MKNFKYAMWTIAVSNSVGFITFCIMIKILDLFSWLDSTKPYIWIPAILLCVLIVRDDIKTIKEFDSLNLEQ